MFETKAVSLLHVMRKYAAGHLKEMSMATAELGKVYKYTYTFGKKQDGAMSPVTVKMLLTADNRWVLSVELLRDKVYMPFDRLHHIMGEGARISYEELFVVGRLVTTDEAILSRVFDRVAAEEW